jgi:hypothetical protein
MPPAATWQSCDGGSLVLETVAPPSAIIHAIEYPEPFTTNEIDQLKRDYPGCHIIERHEEREYIVDRWHLKDVKVVRRLPMVPLPEMEVPLLRRENPGIMTQPPQEK